LARTPVPVPVESATEPQSARPVFVLDGILDGLQELNSIVDLDATANAIVGAEAAEEGGTDLKQNPQRG
ncbi:MAG: hypothetical protein P8X82_16385, partial [Gemmatimonadales bacterium]